MRNNRIVLDTNCLLACISSKSENFRVWKGFQEGKFVLCVSNEILEEYQEIIAQRTTANIAQNIVRAIVESDYVDFIDTHFRLFAITEDIDDNKFVDCAFAGNAAYIVSNDTHFNVLKSLSFPQILVMKLQEFVTVLASGQ